MFQRKADVIQSFEQAVTGKLVNLEAGREAMIIVNFPLLQVNGQMVVRVLLRPANEFLNLGFSEHDRKHAVLYAIIGKNICERRSNHRPKAKILQRPYGMFARRTTSEILAGHENAGSFVTWMVQRKGWVVGAVFGTAPVVEQKFAEAGTLDSLQELFGDDLVSIYVMAMERGDFAFVFAERLHFFSAVK